MNLDIKVKIQEQVKCYLVNAATISPLTTSNQETRWKLKRMKEKNKDAGNTITRFQNQPQAFLIDLRLLIMRF